MALTFRPRFFLPEETIEGKALQQVYQMSSLPILAGPIAIMPDCHYGKGAVVGSVVPTRNAVLPASVGVDLSCGMVAAKLNLSAEQLPESLGSLRTEIESLIPVGFNTHPDVPSVKGASKTRMEDLMKQWKELSIRKYIPEQAEMKIVRQFGTLGGGNHFCEVCLDTNKNVWIMLHSGSRNIGKVIAEETINRAKEQYADQIRDLPDKDLVWLPDDSVLFKEYTEALEWAGEYASLNRRIMFERMVEALQSVLGIPVTVRDHVVNCHHNYVQKEVHNGENLWITRKGAVSARKGEYGIIPGAMGARSFIVCGKGNEDSYSSCSHGAGRRFSRGEAKRRFTEADLIRTTKGVECRKDAGVLDEIRDAYKDIDEVMNYQKDLVDIVAELKSVLCIKG